MNLEEMREKLEIQDNETIQMQEKLIQTLKDEIEKLEHIIEVHEQRCIVLTKGSICYFCEYKNECKTLIRSNKLESLARNGGRKQ